MFSREFIDDLMTDMGAIQLSTRSAPDLVATVQRMAKQSKIIAPNIYIIDKLDGMGNIGKINAAALDKHAIILTRGILDLYGNSDLQGPTDRRLAAVIGHELYHNKTANFAIGSKVLPVLLMPLAAMIGYHLYRKANKKKEQEEKAKALEKEAGQLEERVEKENSPETHSILKKVITFAKYLAAAVLGLIAGKFIQSQLSIFQEYEADAHSKKLMGGDPEPLIEGLQLLSKKMNEIVTQDGFGEDYPKWQQVINQIFPSHPDWEKRETALRL